MKEKVEKDPQITNDRNEKQDITRESVDIEMIRNYCEKVMPVNSTTQIKWTNFLKDTN